jgi:hypothetical protein
MKNIILDALVSRCGLNTLFSTVIVTDNIDKGEGNNIPLLLGSGLRILRVFTLCVRWK